MAARRASPHFENAERYAINVLAHDQADLARRFSRPHADRFEGVDYRLGRAGAPLIAGLRRMVRVPPPRAASGRRSRSIHRRPSTTCARNKGAGLVFHHGRFGTTHTAG